MGQVVKIQEAVHWSTWAPSQVGVKALVMDELWELVYSLGIFHARLIQFVCQPQ